MKKRYQATLYIIQKNDDNRQIYHQDTFRFKWWARIFLFMTLVDTAHLADLNMFAFEPEIVEL